MNRLLKKALEHVPSESCRGRKSKISDDDAVALGVAWGMGAIRYSSVQAALGHTNSATIYCVLARGLRIAVERGILVTAKPAKVTS